MKKTFINFHPKKMTRKEQKNVFILLLAKLGFSKLDPSQKITKARDFVSDMTGNANFPTPTPALATVTAAIDALEVAEMALDGSKIKTQERNDAEAALDTLMSGLQGYVDSASLKNPVKILSAGFEVRDPKTAVGLLGPVTDITAKLGKFVGTIDLNWKGIKNSKLYVVEARPFNNPAADWTLVGESTKSKITIDELQSGETYTFRIFVVSTAGVGPESETVNIRVY